MLHTERSNNQNKVDAIKTIMSLRRNQRSITQQKQILSHTKTEEQKSLLFLIEKSKDFTSIFTKHKRSQYSGYKQVNMNKSKIIRFEHQHRETGRYQTPRKYQMNLKNIAKLRKRYSLEPSHFKQSSRTYKSHLIQTLKPIERTDQKVLQICSDRKCQRQLKEIIRQIKTSKYFSSENDIFQNEKLRDATTQRNPKKISANIQGPYDQQHSSLQASQKMKEAENRYNFKLSAIKAKKNKKIQINDNFEKHFSKNTLKINEQDENLCGWESQSFYPKRNVDFFQSFKT